MKNDTKIYIVGAGLSGLVAALELENAGFSPVILEGSDGVGGRVRTDKEDGFLFDRGFQVLLTAYPEAKKYLDYEALKLKKFEPGALILQPGNAYSIGDPLRNPAHLPGMLFSPVGNLSDKFKIYQLTKKLQKITLEEIFEEPSQTTLEFLKDFGFSDQIIGNFFRPFFRGIFLETKLETSSKMFKFVFKLFSEGHAAVPEMGMQAIPDQLASKLKKTEIRLNTPVQRIEGKNIFLYSGEQIEADKIIIAGRPDRILSQMEGQIKPFRKVVNLYFSMEKSFIGSPKIALVTDDNFLINNLVFMTDVSKAYSSNDKALLSVSVVKDVPVNEQLAKKVAIELEVLTKIAAEHFHLLKIYEIVESLPQVEDISHHMDATHAKIYDHVFLAGDYLLNGSINAAMTSGRKAAEALILSTQSVI